MKMPLSDSHDIRTALLILLLQKPGIAYLFEHSFLLDTHKSKSGLPFFFFNGIKNSLH